MGALGTEVPAVSDGGQCPFVRVRRMKDVADLVRSKTAVYHRAELFAAVDADPVNGEINVREFLAGSMMYVEGDSHKDRRKILNQLVRPDALDEIREDIIVPRADLLMAQRLARPDADGQYRMDLVEFLEQVFINFTAKLIGLVDVDSEERMTLLRSCAGPIAAGSSSGFLEDRDAVNERALAAKKCYVDEFFMPSLRWYEEAGAKVEAGEMSDADVPKSLIKLVAARAHPVWEDLPSAIVESTLLFAASVGTSTQSVIHTVDFLQGWFQEHPEDYERRTDLTFLLNALQETIRLRAPFSPYTTRLACEERVLSDGTEVHPGQELHIEWVAANRDPEVFGEDANDYNPWRPSPANGLPRFGVGFGIGAHQCYGMRVVVGNDGLGGSHVRLLQKLIAAGVRPDPANPPVGLKKRMDKFSIEDIPRYTSFPAIFPDWRGAAEERPRPGPA
jgi:cytochrome P450